MGLSLKMDNPVFFEKVGVSPVWADAFTASDLTMQLGFFEMKLFNAQGQLLEKITLPANTSNIMKGKADPNELSAAKNMIEDALKKYLGDGKTPYNVAHASAEAEAPPDPPVGVIDKDDDLYAEILGEEKPKTAFKKLQDTELAPDLSPGLVSNEADTGIPTAMTIPNVLKMAPVDLKNAKMMYQPTRGTSPGSTYHVVAIGAGVNVAVRILHDEVSVRVEGKITPAVSQAFSQVAITSKGNYLSGHFTLHGKVTPNRLIGSILLGTGLPFKTPLPVLDYIKGVG